MFLTQRIIFQINVRLLLGYFDLYTEGYFLFCLLSLKLNYYFYFFSTFMIKSLRLFFVPQNLKTEPKFKKLLTKRKTITINKIAFALKFEIQDKFFTGDLNKLTIHPNITALIKLNLRCLFPLLFFNKTHKIDVLRIG